MDDIVWFDKIDKDDVKTVGGKGANLGELTRINAPVPPGFIVTAQAYFASISKSGALDRIRGILYDLDPQNPIQLETKALQCQAEILKIGLDSKLENNLNRHYRQLSGKNDTFVAVRSSATAEDLPEASFAGQQSTYLNVRGEKRLKDALISVWASLFEARAIFYRAVKNYDHFKVGIAVPVQKMIQSEISGVMFTVDPVTGDKKKIIIEAIFGLGELIVSGQETPDHYEVAKSNMKIISKSIAKQHKQLVGTANGNRLLTVSKKYQREQKLTDTFIIELAKIGLLIENHYFFAQDIEWALTGAKIYIVQTRPVTTTKAADDEKNLDSQKGKFTQKILIQGAPASPAKATGPVVIIKDASQMGKVKTGDVLVTQMTNPDFVPAMRRAVAVVTDRGGRTSHAAIVSRELGLACVVGTGNATKVLKEGMWVTVDGTRGLVYKGSQPNSRNQVPLASKKASLPITKTATKLFVNLAEPSLAAKTASQDVDGVGLLRAEFILAQIGTHPKKYLEEGKGEVFIDELAQNLSIFGKAFGNRPVIYRATDLKSNEYRNLKGGERYESRESNPMLGYRGAYRYIKDPDVFKLELSALKRARGKYQNLHLMIPFVRSAKELELVKNMVEKEGLFVDSTFKFYMMVEIPANVVAIEDFIKIGIDGVSIGSNDLTMLMLGLDRDNEELAFEFSELDPSVLWALKKTIEAAAKYKITSSICGQGPSVYPELTKMLVNWGISSISVNPDVVNITRRYIYEAEHKQIKQKTAQWPS